MVLFVPILLQVQITIKVFHSLSISIFIDAHTSLVKISSKLTLDPHIVAHPLKKLLSEYLNIVITGFTIAPQLPINEEYNNFAS